MRFASLGSAFALLACSSTPQVYGPTYDGGDAATEASPDGGDAEASEAAATDAPVDSSPIDATTDAPTCSSTVALVGGNTTTLFGAGGPGNSALVASSLSSSLADCGNDFGCASSVAITRLGSGLLAVVATSNGTLESTPYASSWADPISITTAKTIDGPALATIGSVAHLLFQGADYKYYHAQYTQSAWDSASDPVGGSGSSQSYGARGPAVAAVTTTLVALQAGSDSYLYDQTWSGSWAAAHQQGGAAIQNTLPPSIAALSGGSSELLAVYLRNGDYKVMAVARTSGVWGTPALVDPNAFSNDPLAITPLPNGRALVVFRGSDKKPYFTTWDGQSTWTTAAAVLATNPEIESTPSVAPGVCGADAVVAWAESGGGVTVVNYANGAFGSPQSVSGTSGGKYVAVGTIP